MLYIAGTLFVLALIAGFFSFGGVIQVASPGIAEFFLGSFLAVLALVLILYVTKQRGDGPNI